jgi:GT2 family glycosyltransferase
VRENDIDPYHPSRLVVRVLDAAERVAPPGTARGRVMRRWRTVLGILRRGGVPAVLQYWRERGARRDRNAVSPPTADDIRYQGWLADHQPTDAELATMREVNRSWAYRPVVSVIVPVYNTRPEWLDAMVASVRAQAYERWELCLADDHSPARHVRPALNSLAATDDRIRVAFREKNGRIAAASNTALGLAGGEYVALLDHDDVLRPQALHRVVELLQQDRGLDLVYTDEDKILLGGARGQVHFKGGFDPDYLLSTNYVCHLSVIRRSLLVDIGGFRSGFDGSQDHDLLLRVTERARVGHVADVLYSWKQVPGSASLEHDEKPQAWSAGLRAVNDALARRGGGGRAEFGPWAGLYTARYPVPDHLTATVIVLAAGPDTTVRSLAALRRGAPAQVRRWVVVGHGRAVEAVRGPGVEVVDAPPGTPAARILNGIVGADASDVVVCVAGDLVPARGGQWLGPLLEQAAREGSGVVGGRILAPDGEPEQEGLHVGGPRPASLGVRLQVIQRVPAVGVDCLAVRASVLRAVGGFDERYLLSCHDVDLCLRIRREGRPVIYTPLTVLRRLHPRAAPLPADDDAAALAAAWEGSPEWADPFISPWLERLDPFAIRGYG